MDRCQSVPKKAHPKQTSNLLSRFSFFYTLKIFVKGYKTSLQTENLYKVLENCQSRDLGDELEKQWQIDEKQGKLSICRTLWTCYGKTFLLLGLMQLVVKTVTTTWSPAAQSKLISYFSPSQTDLSKQDAIYYACVVIGLVIFNLFFCYNYTLALTELGIRVRTAVCSLLYRKSLQLSSESLSDVTVGKIVTIMTKDVDVFFNFIYFGNEVWIPLVQTGIICYLIYSKIGVSSLAGIAVFLIVLPLQAFIAKLSYSMRLESSKKTDQRLELLQEVLSSIKIIKMYTWEKFFEKKINNARKDELKKLQRLFCSKVWIVIIGSVCSKLAALMLFVTYLDINAEVVYYVISCFADLEYSLSTLVPVGLSYTAEAYATTKRIDTVLTIQDRVSKQETINDAPTPKIILTGVSIKMKNVSLLKSVFLNFNTGLNVITGGVGNGKTTLLKSILQECKIDGDIKISGRISYASQEPWLFPSTIRNNIVFGEKYCEKRYTNILKICNLDYDLNLLAEGDSTIIGDRGINLSKGQQTRINLARALYKQSDIYLLDDCLASLDVYVATHIFEECMRKFLKDKLCVFVTNTPEHVQKADNIFLIREGSIKVCKIDKTGLALKEATPEESKNKETVKILDDQDVYQEVKKSGKVDWNVYYRYVASGSGVIIFGAIMALFIAAQFTSNYSDKLISDWVTAKENLSNNMTLNQTNDFQDKTNSKFYMYVMMVTSSTTLSLIKWLAFFNFARTASMNLHKSMTRSVINSTMTFFDCNFLGNILNRFSKDCLTIDENLPYIIAECLAMVFTASGGIILIATIDVTFLVESLFLIACACCLKYFYQPTGRNLQRLTIATRSPMVGHLNSTLEGLVTIRASNAQQHVIDEFDRHQDLYTSANYMANNCQIALGFGLEFIASIFIGLVIVQFLVTDADPSVGDVGLAITQSFVITEIITTGIKSLSDCENLMTSVERIVEYTQLEQENGNGSEEKNWPKEGSLDFSHVSLNYGNSDQPVLKDISFNINPKEKLGIVGRTGSGKSSIISSLLNLYKTQGKITVDNVDIQSLSLHCLRSKISVIPQDPFLFSGSLRENLDPFLKYPDEKIWRVLEQLRIKDMVTGLNVKIDKGSSFSAGQKQLLCITRAILQKNKMVILDEAMANVDQETDLLIQEAVQNHFSNSTVITVAHKLNSILKCDKVLVLDRGRVSEFGNPSVLLENKNSFLRNVNG